MLFFKKKAAKAILVFNTASRQKEPFTPLQAGKVRMYSCGPTVYDYAHIGNLRSYVFSDIVRRTLEYAHLDVRQVINITDFGHLVGDADDTEDKMTLALRREGKELSMENMFALADVYIAAFKSDIREMNIRPPHAMPRASEHVGGMIAYVETLLHKGMAYQTSDGVYFDTVKFSHYGFLDASSGEKNASVEHSRIKENTEKHNSADFALWKFNTNLGWSAPWGKGFPGWHIECTAMSTQYLGKTFDIHTGGVDHVAVHHNNEAAQAEAANGRPLARYWLHHEFITVDGARIGKSEGNAITLTQLSDRGVSPLAYRYWLLTGHYRQRMNFTWEAVEAAQTALQRARRLFAELKESRGGGEEAGGAKKLLAYRARFDEALFDDFNTAEAIAVLWELLKDDSVPARGKRETILAMDRVLGVGFGNAALRGETLSLPVIAEADLPEEAKALIARREASRAARNFETADRLRGELNTLGYTLEDGPEGVVVKRR